MVSQKKSDRNLPYQGLTSQQVQVNRQQYGNNVLTPPKRDPWWKLYLAKFADPVIRILMIAAFLTITIGIFEGEYAEGLGIIIAILLATTVAFINEYKANQEFELLNQVYDQVVVKVIRDGRFTTIPRKDLVVGDIVYVEQGKEIPADGTILEAVSLYIDQAKITGESEPVAKFSLTHIANNTLEDSSYPSSKLYRSTIVKQGHGFFELTAVGDQTEIGKVAQAVATVETGEETPLNIQLEKLSQLIGFIGLSVSGLTFLALLIRGLLSDELILTYQQGYFVVLLIGSVIISLSCFWLPIIQDGLKLAKIKINPLNWLNYQGNRNIQSLSWFSSTTMGLILLVMGISIGYPLGMVPSSHQIWLPTDVATALLNYFMVAVTIIVVAVPEGLAMSVTLSLAYSMKKMAASNNLVRRMHACETIGAATVICSDKTGTLTRNQMWVDEVNFPCLDSHHRNKVNYCHDLIAESIAVNSTADLEKKTQQSTSVIGNATEGSLLLWLDNLNIDYITYRGEFKVKYQIPFSTEKKYMVTFGTSSVLENDVLYLKGAPEVVLGLCDQLLTAEGIEPLTDTATIVALLREYQVRGMRTLGFAYRHIAENLQNIDLEHLENNLIWLGFVSISDPLRSEVPTAINTCLDAGIQVKVVTGDSSQTAQEIARQIGLWQEDDLQQNNYVHLTGNQFKQLSDEEALEAVQSLKILSRAYPLDKLRLVQLLQKNGHVVGVTGDGTNDAAALKQAQVGLSMGSGSAIAKEASDIILLDDSFGSIVNAVVWGRSLYENIQRFILFQLTINVAALGIALLGPFIGIELPLTVTQMLWVNLIMDTFAALALATEPPHWNVMERPPRSPEAFIVSPSMTRNIFTTGLCFLIFLVGFLIYLRQDGLVSAYELSLFFAVFVLLQFWNLFNARCLGLDKFVFSGLGKNKGFIAIAIAIFIGQILIIQFGGNVFRTVPLSFSHWITIILGTSLVLWIGELWRFLGRLNKSQIS